MTDYIGQLGIQDLIDKLEEKLGTDWFRNPYTKFEDVLSPNDPDMNTILDLRKKTKGNRVSHPRGHRSDSFANRLSIMRNDIKAQIQGGWTREKIAKVAGVSPATMTRFIHSDYELSLLFKQRGRVATKPGKTLQVIRLHEQGFNKYQIKKRTGLDNKAIDGIIIKYEVGVLTTESLKRYN